MPLPLLYPIQITHIVSWPGATCTELLAGFKECLLDSHIELSMSGFSRGMKRVRRWINITFLCRYPNGVPWKKYSGVHDGLNLHIVVPGKDLRLGMRPDILSCTD